MFYVLEGVLTVRPGEQTREFGAGSFVRVPSAVVHTFSSSSARPVRFLNCTTPADWERYMRDFAQAAKSARLTPEVIGTVASRDDFHPVYARGM